MTNMLVPSALFDLTGRVAIATGASSGLGVGMAAGLAAAGATVVVMARREDKLKELCSRHERMEAVACDVADDASIERAVERVLAEHGCVDVLVNNAGTTVGAKAEDESMADFRYVMDVNLNGAFLLSQLCGRAMLAQGRGSIVNIASILGLVAGAPASQAGYCASKGALVNLTRELAVQWADRGVRVNAIAPGWFRSELTEEMLDSESGQRFVLRNTPMRRAGQLGELVGTLLLLASDAGSYITGQTIPVDGGWTAR